MYKQSLVEQHLEKIMTLFHVVQSGSIRKYSQLSKLSQPAVSQSIAKLEKIVGLPLLERSREGVSLTAAGSIFYTAATKINETICEGELQLTQLLQVPANFSFGTYDSIAVYLLPKLIEKMNENKFKFELTVSCKNSAEILKQVEAGSIDCALVVNPQPSNNYDICTVGKDFFSFYKSKQAKDDTLIVESSTVLSNGTTLENFIQRHTENKYQKIISAPSFEIALSLVEANIGIGILPCRVAHRLAKVNKIALYKMSNFSEQFFDEHSIAFVTKKRISLTPEMLELKEILKLALQEQNS